MALDGKHTHGPWQAGRFATVVSTAGLAVPPKAPLTSDDDEYYGGRLVAESILNQADRRLIAAAPELLQACVAAIEEDCGLACAKQLAAAIHAATGQEQEKSGSDRAYEWVDMNDWKDGLHG
jgi:hypothetical protein